MGVADEYAELRRLEPGQRRAWLRDHAPDRMRSHWWLELWERIEHDAIIRPSLVPMERRRNLELLVEYTVLGVTERLMPPYYAATRLSLIAKGQLESGSSDMPDELSPDAVARRCIDSFRLTESEALAAAARENSDLIDNENAWAKPGQPINFASIGADDDIARLQEIRHVLLDLDWVVDYIEDKQLAEEVRRWLNLRARLDISEEAAERGAELLRQSRDEKSAPGSSDD